MIEYIKANAAKRLFKEALYILFRRYGHERNLNVCKQI